MRTLYRIFVTTLLVGFLGYLLLFTIRNFQQRVSLDLLFRQLADVPLLFVVLGATLAGVVVTFLTSVAEDLRKGREIRRLQQENRRLQERVHQLEPPGDG